MQITPNDQKATCIFKAEHLPAGYSSARKQINKNEKLIRKTA